MGNKIAAIWARVSDPKQEEPSLDRQVATIREWLETQGYTIPEDKTIQIVWTSTNILECPEMQMLLTWVKTGQVNAIGMTHLDRLSGKPGHMSQILEIIKDANCELLAKDTPLPTGLMGELMGIVISLGKAMQVDRADNGAKDGLKDRAIRKGLPPTKKRVFGMIFEESKYIPDENYDNACLIFDLWFERPKLDYICGELVKRGIPTSTGKRIWLPSSAIAILKNPVYAGRVATLKYEKIEPNKRLKNTFGKTSRRIRPESEWHWLEGRVEKPVITWAQYLAILERLKLNKANASRNAKHNYLAKGVIECMLCGRHYYGIKQSNGRRKYACSNQWAIPSYRDKCMAKPLDCEAVEHDIKAKVRSFLEQPDRFLQQLNCNLNQFDADKQEIETKIKDLERQQRRTVEDEIKASKLLSEEAFQSEQKLILTRRQWLSEEIERQQQKLADLTRLEVNRDNVEQLRNRLQNNLDNATFENWRFIIDTLCLKVLSFGDGTWDIEVGVPASETSIANNTAGYIHR
jgi:hypothetical protein